MYIMSGEELSEQSVSGTSLQITFAPGETVAFTFPVVKQNVAPGREPESPVRRRIPRP